MQSWQLRKKDSGQTQETIASAVLLMVSVWNRADRLCRAPGRSVDRDMEDIQARLQHDAELEERTQQLLAAAQTREVLQAPSQ